MKNGLRVMLISSLKPGEEPELISDDSAVESEGEGDEESEDGEFEKSDVNCGSCTHEESPKLRKAAAALCVNVGSFSDPLEAQGLAHFLEHMVFMGSEKYPRENDFDDYVCQRDGFTNAFTDGEFTIFYFDIQRRHFGPALDKFANFFVSPLLSEDCVNRELEAVHSEYELAKANDHWRLEHFVSSLAKDGTPYRKFGFGNRISLKDNPTSIGTNVYEMLRQFQLRYYTSQLMTLAIESKVCPIKEMVTLNFIWSLPSMLPFYKAAPLKFLGAVVGYEGKGSLLAFLREQNLAVELCAGTVTTDNTRHNQMTSLFSISVELSELGRELPFTVASHVFSYLQMLRAAADFSLENPDASTSPSGGRTLSSLVPEYQKLCAAKFRFQEPLDPCDTVQVVAMSMQTFPSDEVYVADSLLLEPDLKLYVDIIRRLTPETAIVTLTQYFFPLATNFDLLPREEDDEVPVDLNLEPGRENARAFGQLWHQQRTKFNVPIAHVTVRLCSNIPKSAKQKAILHLWACALDQRLQTLVYSASEAGLLFSVSAVSNGLEIQVSGFNEKLFLLYQEIFDLLCAPLTNSDAGLLNDRKFSTYKDSHIRKYLTDATEHLVVDYMKALEALSLDDFVQFVPQMLSQIYLKAFVYGNLSKTEALSFFDYALSSLKPPKAAVLTSLPIPEFPVCVNRLRVMNFNKVDVNTCLSLVTPLQGTPSDDLKLEVMNELFVSCLKEPAFAYLRTSETLGYSVGLYSWLLLSTTRQCGATLTVCSQANKFDSSLVAGRMYAFWYRIIPQIIFRLKPEAFQTAGSFSITRQCAPFVKVDSMIASNRLEDATMEVEMRRNRAEILSSVPIFDRRQRAISILQNLTLKDFQDFYRSTYFNNDRQPVLMLQVRSSKFFSNQYIL
ncbi:unnamed protein product [Mesocestoides corti]|uniref:Peptidase M16 N-terminal domain-containing protein n=1 Tax=Mesocestoides corti TaxID=53468 RepID=A0A3P6I515_MESCO|nr:unnamed protein product [Mesocestoides corti]